jgi:hypothetical protein
VGSEQGVEQQEAAPSDDYRRSVLEQSFSIGVEEEPTEQEHLPWHDPMFAGFRSYFGLASWTLARRREMLQSCASRPSESMSLSKRHAAKSASDMNGTMLFPDLDDARKHHAALLEIIIHNAGGWADRTSLRKVVELCHAARSAIDDAACSGSLCIVARCAADLFSEQAHRRWDRPSLSGADFLRLEVMRALHLFSHRLTEIERTRTRSAP